MKTMHERIEELKTLSVKERRSLYQNYQEVIYSLGEAESKVDFVVDMIHPELGDEMHEEITELRRLLKVVGLGAAWIQEALFEIANGGEHFNEVLEKTAVKGVVN